MFLLLAGCGPKTDDTTRLLSSVPYVDCGDVAGGSVTCEIPLFSDGTAPVTILAARLEALAEPEGAGEAFVLLDDWATDACSAGRSCRTLDASDRNSDADTLMLTVVFAPQVYGFYRTELTIWSNDTDPRLTEVRPDAPNDLAAVWKVQLRGIASPACGHLWPRFADLGPSEGAGSVDFWIENCGTNTLTVSGLTGDGAGDMETVATLPLYLLPGAGETLSIPWTILGPEDAVERTFSTVSNSATLDTLTATFLVNHCDGSVDPGWDNDADGWSTCGGDCDDTDAAASPSVVEGAANTLDDDCDGLVDEEANDTSVDDDADGATEAEGDCDDSDASIGPSSVENADGVDQDCDGTLDEDTERSDDDGDGYSEREGDCDDISALVGFTSTETLDGIDNDCDGLIDEGGPLFDDDGDGFAEDTSDCDDGDPWIYPGGFEFCDAVDNDCDLLTDEGEDDFADAACLFAP